MKARKHEIAIEKIKETLLRMIDVTNQEIKEGEEVEDIVKVAFHNGAKAAMEKTLEDIYSDTIELN